MNTSSLHRLCWLLALVCLHTPAHAGIKAGDPFPDVTTFKLEGELPQSLKGKVVLLDFWASWCGPCAASFPVMESLNKQYAEKGLMVLAISVDEKRAAMDGFLKKHKPTFAVVRDVDQKLVAAAEAKAMPTSYLLDRSGKVRFIHSGFRGEETHKEYVKEIEQLLNEK